MEAAGCSGAGQPAPKRPRVEAAPGGGEQRDPGGGGGDVSGHAALLLPLIAAHLLAEPPPAAAAAADDGPGEDAAAAAAAAALRDADFEGDFALAGGAPCLPTLRRALAAAAAHDAAALALPARALRDACWEQLHSGHWAAVDVAWRDAYSLATLLAAAAAVDGDSGADGAAAAAAVDPDDGGGARGDRLQAALRQVDLAAMMGGPRFRAAVDAAAASLEAALDAAADGGDDAGGAQQPPLWLDDPPEAPAPLPPGSLADPARRVPVLSPPPALEAFLMECMVPGRPAVIRGALEAWPARARWRDARYLMRAAGRRTVPVEAGATYLEAGAALVTLRSFLEEHVLPARARRIAAAATAAAATAPAGGGGGDGDAEQRAAAPKDGAPSSSSPPPAPPPSPPRAYLAQHELFAQLPALARDVAAPDYCALGQSGAPPAVNAWLGPAGTVTPLHQDPPHNLLAQVMRVLSEVLRNEGVLLMSACATCPCTFLPAFHTCDRPSTLHHAMPCAVNRSSAASMCASTRPSRRPPCTRMRPDCTPTRAAPTSSALTSRPPFRCSRPRRSSRRCSSRGTCFTFRPSGGTLSRR